MLPGSRRLRRSGVRVATVLVAVSRVVVMSVSPHEVSPSTSCSAPRVPESTPPHRVLLSASCFALNAPASSNERAASQSASFCVVASATPKQNCPRRHHSKPCGAVGEDVRTRLTLANGVVLGVIRARVAMRARRVAVGVVADVRSAAVVVPRLPLQSGSCGHASPCRTRCRRPMILRVARYPSTHTPSPSWSASFTVVRSRVSAATRLGVVGVVM